MFELWSFGHLVFLALIGAVIVLMAVTELLESRRSPSGEEDHSSAPKESTRDR